MNIFLKGLLLGVLQHCIPRLLTTASDVATKTVDQLTLDIEPKTVNPDPNVSLDDVSPYLRSVREKIARYKAVEDEILRSENPKPLQP